MLRHALLPFLLSPLSLAAPPAAAGVAEFLATCAADGVDLARLPERLAAVGWAEVDAEAGPFGPAHAGSAARRLWSLPGWNGGDGNAYTGFSPASLDHPFEVCWHVSRPGESGAAALAALRRRFPPTGPAERGEAIFYGGWEHWPARVGGGTVLIEVVWPVHGHPQEGVSMLVLTRVNAGGAP